MIATGRMTGENGRNHLTGPTLADSLRAMSTRSVVTKGNASELASAIAVAASWYWFGFSYVYYGSPATLVEQEVRRR